METKSFLGIEGLNHFWEKAKIWIINEITTKIAGIVLSSVPVGTVLQGLYTTVPNGFLLCNGQEVAIASFHKLYTEIGKLEVCQSANEGMFKVPDLRGRFLEGANGNLGKRIEAGLPNITGTFYHDRNAMFELSGAFSYTNGRFLNLKNDDNVMSSGYVSFNASKSNAIYGKSTTVQPPAVCVNYIIKY